MLKDAAVESAWMWLVLLSLPAVFLVRSIAKVFLSLDEISAYNLIGYAPSVVGLGVGISGMVFLGTGLGSLFLGFAIAYYGAVLLGLCYLGRRVPLKLNIKLTVIRDLFGYGTRLYASNLVEYLHYRADILLVAYLLTPTEVGYYSLALSIVETLRKLPVAAAAALFPKMASAAREFAVALSAQACRHLSLLGVVFAIPFYLSVKVVLTVYLGDGYRPVVLLILTLLPGIIVVSLVPVLRSHFFGRGAPSYVIGASLVGLAANVLANLMLIPSFGVLGAAVSSSISYLISTSILVACFATVENVSVGAVLLPERRDLSLYRQCWPRFLTLKPRVASSD
jgi:O-antigen/teichoic acid export membrane protein